MQNNEPTETRELDAALDYIQKSSS